MSHQPLNLVRAGSCGAVAVMILCFSAAAPAQSASSPSDNVPGRVILDFAGAPPAKVEVDLSEGILSDLSGIGQAAVTGLTEALLESAEGRGGPSVEAAAQQLEAAQQIVQTVSGLLHELRVRVYELPDSAQGIAADMANHYQEKLRESAWDNFIRVRDGDENVNLSLMRQEGAIRGVFLIVVDGDDVVILNAVCDLSPDRVEEVANQAAKIGMQFGLEDVLEEVMEKLQKEMR